MTEQELLERIGARIRELRKQQGLTQMDLAASIESEFQNISRVETGKVNPGICFLYKISQALGVTLSELLEVGV